MYVKSTLVICSLSIQIFVYILVFATLIKKNMKSKTNFVKNKRINMSWSCEKWKLPCRVKQR